MEMRIVMVVIAIMDVIPVIATLAANALTCAISIFAMTHWIMMKSSQESATKLMSQTLTKLMCLKL